MFSSSMFDRIFVVFSLFKVSSVLATVKLLMPSVVCLRVPVWCLLQASFSIETDTCSRSFQVLQLVGMVCMYAIMLYILYFLF